MIDVNAAGVDYATSPSTETAQFLVECFHGFFLKYLKLLQYGKIGNNLTCETKDFLSLLTPKNPTASKQERLAAMRIVAERLPNAFGSMNADDLYNELVVIFLERAARFNPALAKDGSNFGFTGYIKYYFKFDVKAKLFKCQNDATNYQPFHSGDIDESDTETAPGSDKASETADTNGTGDTLGLPYLNRSFISSPEAPFDTLWTKQQRNIMILKYKDDLSWSAIADQLQLGNAKKVEQLHNDAIQKYRAYFHVAISEETEECY